ALSRGCDPRDEEVDHALEGLDPKCAATLGRRLSRDRSEVLGRPTAHLLCACGFLLERPRPRSTLGREPGPSSSWGGPTTMWETYGRDQARDRDDHGPRPSRPARTGGEDDT